MTTSSEFEPIRDAFAFLRAEDEEAWLPSVYIEPTQFNAMCDLRRSSVIFGASGSGKSALRQYMANRVTQLADVSLRPLIVDWHPKMIPSGQVGSVAALRLISEAKTLCASAILKHIVVTRQEFQLLREWAQKIIASFLKFNLGERLEIELDQLAEIYDQSFAQKLGAMLVALPTVPPKSDYGIDNEVMAALKIAGVSNLWLMMDNLEPWLEADVDELGRSIQSLLASLAFFEIPGLTLKMLLPDALEGRVKSSSVLTRRRVDSFKLEWTKDHLRAIVDARLSRYLDSTIIEQNIAVLGAALSEQLLRNGGQQPRGWLALAQPLADAFVNQQVPMLVDSLPKIRVESNDRIFVGYREITTLQRTEAKILRHLFKKYPDVCTRSELYYLVYLDLPSEPRPQTEGWVPEKMWRGTIDTIIYRIRQEIEPELSSPSYLITVRGKGIRLHNID